MGAGCLPSAPNHTCTACQRLSPAFPVRRGEVSFGRIWSEALRAFGRAWVPLSAGTLVVVLANAVLHVAVGAFQNLLLRTVGFGFPKMLASLVTGGITIALGMGLIRLGVQAYREKEVSLGLLFSEFRQYDKLLGLAGVNMLVTLILSVFTAMSVGPLGLFMLPALLGVALVYWLHFNFMMMSVVIAPHLGFGQHLAFARGLLSGNALTVVALYAVGGLLTAVAVPLLVLPAFAAGAFMNLLALGAFLALANDEGFEAYLHPERLEELRAGH